MTTRVDEAGVGASGSMGVPVVRWDAKLQHLGRGDADFNGWGEVLGLC